MAYGDTIKAPIRKPVRTYSDAELRAFDKQLDDYREIGEFTGKKVLTDNGWKKYMKSKGAITVYPDGKWAVRGEKTMTGEIDCSKYEEQVHKLACLADYQGRIKYGEQKKLEQYEANT